MEETTGTTLENIQRAALTEFLDKGFLGASLRQIVKMQGLPRERFMVIFPAKRRYLTRL